MAKFGYSEETFAMESELEEDENGNAVHPQVLICKKCNGKIFNVGQSDCLTVIRYIKCKWEESIHEG